MDNSSMAKFVIQPLDRITEDQIIICNIVWNTRKLANYLSLVKSNKQPFESHKMGDYNQFIDNSLEMKHFLQNIAKNNVIAMSLQYTSNTKEQLETNKNNISHNKDVAGDQEYNIMDNLSSELLESINQFNHQQYRFSSNQVAWVQQIYKQYLSSYKQFVLQQGLKAPTEYWMQQPFGGTLYSVYNFALTVSIQNENLQVTPRRVEIVNDNRNMDANNADDNSNDNNVNNNIANNNNNNNQQENINNNDREDIAFGQNRDWLDHFYVLSRIIVLFSIVYFYSSPIRFVIVTFLGILIYLYQNGFFRTYPIAVIENNQEQIRNNNQPIPENVNNMQAVEVPVQNNPENDPESSIRIVRNNGIGEERRGALSFIWIFFSSFIASLVPDRPNVA